MNAAEGAEKEEPSHAAGGSVNWYSHCGNNREAPQKTKNRIAI